MREIDTSGRDFETPKGNPGFSAIQTNLQEIPNQRLPHLHRDSIRTNFPCGTHPTFPLTMKTTQLILLTLGLASFQASAQDEVRYFRLITPAENDEPEYEESVALWVSGESAGGTQFAGSEGTHSAYGNLVAVVRPDGIIHATWNYDIEGSEQSEEQLLKLDGDTLYLGEGELEERGPGQMVLKDPAKVVFEKALKEVEMSELSFDSGEAAPHASALKEAVSKLVGAQVNLEGTLRSTQGWIRFLGFVTPAEGVEVKNEAFAGSLGEEFQILLKQDAEKKWQLVRHGFRGPDGYFELQEASEEYESAPWPLEEELFMR
jgi:hypothetical protein